MEFKYPPWHWDEVITFTQIRRQKVSTIQKQNKNKRKMISVLSGRLRGACGWIGGANDAESFRSQADRHSLTHFSHVQLHSSLLSFTLSILSFILLAQSHSHLSYIESELFREPFFSMPFTRLSDYDNFDLYHLMGFQFKTKVQIIFSYLQAEKQS